MRILFLPAVALILGCGIPEITPSLSCASGAAGLEQCQKADIRYTVCDRACAYGGTICHVRCYLDSDCTGSRANKLPADWIYCNVPRPGEGYCSATKVNYGDGGVVCDP